MARQNLRDSGFNPAAFQSNGQLSVCVLAKISRLSVKPVNRTGDNVKIFFLVVTEAEQQEQLHALSRFLRTDGGADAAVTYARERQTRSNVKWESPVPCTVVERQEWTELDEKKRKRKGTKPGQPVRKFSVGAWAEKGRWELPLKESKEAREDIASVTGVCSEEALELAKTAGEHEGVKLSVEAGSVRRILSSGRETILAVPKELGNLGWAKIVRAATEGGVYAYSRWELNGAFLVAHRRDRQLLATYANYVEAADAEKIDAQLPSQALRGAPSGRTVFRDFYWEIERSKRQRPTQRGTGTTGQRLYFCLEGVMVKRPCTDAEALEAQVRVRHIGRGDTGEQAEGHGDSCRDVAPRKEDCRGRGGWPRGRTRSSGGCGGRLPGLGLRARRRPGRLCLVRALALATPPAWRLELSGASDMDWSAGLSRPWNRQHGARPSDAALTATARPRLRSSDFALTHRLRMGCLLLQ